MSDVLMSDVSCFFFLVMSTGRTAFPWVSCFKHLGCAGVGVFTYVLIWRLLFFVSVYLLSLFVLLS